MSRLMREANRMQREQERTLAERERTRAQLADENAREAVGGATGGAGDAANANSANSAGPGDEENVRPEMSIHDFEGATLREKAAAMARALARAKDSGRGGGSDPAPDDNTGGRDTPSDARRELDSKGDAVENAIADQREARRSKQRRQGNAEREISDEHARANTEEESQNAKRNWSKTRAALTAKRAAVHLGGVNADKWTDVNTLFEYYNQTYFDDKLGEVTFSWIDRAADDEDFRYCLCSAVPGWWHGAHKNLMCGVSCCVERRRGGYARRSVHIRMPDAVRKFKLTQMAKEGLLHSMIHAYLFMTGAVKEHEPFYEHGPQFRHMMRRLNNDTLTFDAFRPSGGYDIVFSDAAEAAEHDHLLTQEMLDQLTLEHFKLLYLVSRYSMYALNVTDNETWVRYQPMLVLMYELIVAGVIDYDYAPASAMVAGRRIYLNVTQEGRDNLDDLVEAKLVRALRTIGNDKQPVVAYQITEQGLLRLRASPLSKGDRSEIDEIIQDPFGALMMVAYDEDEETFRLYSDNDFCVDSTVTDTEDVSYVSSPYLPFTLRDLKRPLASNAHRAQEAATGSSNLRDELDVQMTLSRLVILVGEWIPFGCNQIMQLTQRLGAHDRIQGGYFSSEIDRHSTETSLEIPVGLTKVTVNSCDAAQWINIEAEVEFPEDEGITQVENFGIRYQRDGTTLYGLKLEAVMEAILNDISLDNLARVMTDIHIDSSKVTESLCSHHQGKLLEMVFNGNEMNRNKVNVFIAEKITPKLRALRYLDGDALEAELKQIIGDTQHAFDITENDVVIFGEAGVLFAGPECIRHETLLLAYLALKSREDFVTNFFNRLFIIAEEMTKQQALINNYFEDPSHVQTIRHELSRINEDCIMLEEVMRNLQGSVEKDALPEEHMPKTKGGKRLYHILQIPKMQESLRQRVQDCEKQVGATRAEIEFLTEQISIVMASIRTQVNKETKELYHSAAEQMKLNDSTASRDVMQVLITGSLAFAALDRTVGEWSVVWDGWMKFAVTYPLIINDPAAIWFWISMLVWAVIAAFVLYWMKFTRSQESGIIHHIARLDMKVNVPKLFEYVRKRGLFQEDIVADPDSQKCMTDFKYVDNNKTLWEHYTPTITLTVDVRNGVLYHANIAITKPQFAAAKLFPRELQSRLVSDFERWDVVEKAAVGRAAIMESDRSITLMANQPPHGHDREVRIEERTFGHLKEQLALKFCYKVENLLSVTTTREIRNQVVEDYVDDDQQVVMLREYQRIFVQFKGRPDPGMSAFAARLKNVQKAQKAGVKVGLKETKNKGVAKHKKYGETRDEEDFLYGDAAAE